MKKLLVFLIFFLTMSNTQNLLADGYSGWRQSGTGKVACGGLYDGWRQSGTGEVCAGGEL